MGRVAKGSWTMEELRRAIWEWPNETPVTDPLSDRTQRALTATIPFDLYPFCLELISTKDGFISKRLALALIDFILLDKESWTVDPDKILSLRRTRVNKFADTVGKLASEQDRTIENAAKIMNLVEDWHFWNLDKSQFSTATTHLAQTLKLPLFAVLMALVELSRTSYDTGAALHSVVIWHNHIKAEFKPAQLELF